MKIVILGAGQVGKTVSESLKGEANDITLVDRQSEALKDIQNKLDVRTVIGHAAHPDVLGRAGLKDADLLLAITNSDETNIVACQAARFVFNTPKCLARIRSPQYLAHPELFESDTLPIDYVISPEQLVTTYIKHVIEKPTILQAVDFADGKVQLVGWYGPAPAARWSVATCVISRNFQVKAGPGYSQFFAASGPSSRKRMPLWKPVTRSLSPRHDDTFPMP